jgi:DNA-binding IclR family transcriptional regulator
MQNNNNALSVLKVLRRMIDENGRVEIDMDEVCRAASLSPDDLRRCLDDLQYEGYVQVEVACVVCEEWR